MAHHKHPPIKRPRIGFYARNEFALVGTTCERIDGLLRSFHNEFSEELKTLIVTGDHGEKGTDTVFLRAQKRMYSHYDLNEYDDKLLGNPFEIVVVNGNHYPAARQIVCIDPQKAGTLERRRYQLTDVAAVILCDGATEVPDWLREDHPDLPPIWKGNATARLFGLLKDSVVADQPELKALILTGGKSSRMGKDKAGLVYREGKTETDRLAEICRAQGLDTYISVSADPEGEHELPDRFIGLGPMGAIATAFLHDPDAAWLVLACDLPLIEKDLIQKLISKRKPMALATAVRGESKPFPEPLIAIYEPRAYARLLQFLSIGYACPRKVLINSDVAELVVKDEALLTNANTPEERESVLARLKEGKFN